MLLTFSFSLPVMSDPHKPYYRNIPGFLIQPIIIVSIQSVMTKKDDRFPLSSKMYYTIYSISERSLPQKNNVTVPRPVCAPITGPILKIVIFPFALGNFSSTNSFTAFASSKQLL